MYRYSSSLFSPCLLATSHLGLMILSCCLTGFHLLHLFGPPFPRHPPIYWIPGYVFICEFAFDQHVLSLYLFHVLPAFCHILLTRNREGMGFNFTFVSLAAQIPKPADKIPSQSQIYFKYECLIARLLWQFLRFCH